MISVGFLTLGCPKNEVDTDLMRARIVNSDYIVVESLDDADVVVINTCSFIVSATEESIETILDVADTWLGDRANRKIIVAGCLVSRYGDDLKDEFPEISEFVPVANESTILETIERLTGVPAQEKADSQGLRTVEAPFAYVMIADGCHRNCSYCTIPSIRGDFVSKPLDTILKEVSVLTQGGVREIILIGQDITSYGRDLDSGETLVDVINAVCDIESVSWVRLMYLQPDGVTDEIISTMASQEKVVHYIEMPLQHCDKDILRSMARSGGRAQFEEKIAALRSAMPDVVLRTTVIAGYPGETEDQFDQLVEFIETIEFGYVGVFPYSPEDGTAAAILPNQIDEPVRIARTQTIRDSSDSLGWGLVASRIGQTLRVLVEGFDGDTPYGRYYGQAPDIDGIVRLTSGEAEVSVGEFVYVKIEDSVLYDLEGSVVIDG